ERLIAVIWTYPESIALWKLNPEVSSFDNTYRTNRYNMPLFNVAGITCNNSYFNKVLGVVPNETQF
ncbi:uncharacterized protein B0I36DRAFT_250899, partial [Microdochium trichocladiopsis]